MQGSKSDEGSKMYANRPSTWRQRGPFNCQDLLTNAPLAFFIQIAEYLTGPELIYLSYTNASACDHAKYCPVYLGPDSYSFRVVREVARLYKVRALVMVPMPADRREGHDRKMVLAMDNGWTSITTWILLENADELELWHYRVYIPNHIKFLTLKSYCISNVQFEATVYRNVIRPDKRGSELLSLCIEHISESLDVFADCAFLRHLSISDYHVENNLSWIVNCSNLETITLKDVGASIKGQVFACVHGLKELSLHSCHHITNMPPLPRVTTLSIRHCQKVTQWEFLGLCLMLQTLRLDGITAKHLPELMWCGSLTTLSMYDCDQLLSFGLPKRLLTLVVQNCACLKRYPAPRPGQQLRAIKTRNCVLLESEENRNAAKELLAYTVR
jgi:hypothetical protein